MKNIIILVVWIFVGGCFIPRKISTKRMVGTYHWDGDYSLGSTLILNADNTFEYQWVTGLLSGTTKGTWNIEKDTLILNSNRQPTEKHYNIISVPQTKSDFFEIKVVTSNNLSLMANCALLNDNQVVTSSVVDEQGICKLSLNENADELLISHVGMKEVRLKTKDLQSAFILEMYEEDFHRFFTNDKFKIRGRKLFDLSIPKDSDFKKYYKKE